jgi:hypothetical protein
LFHLFDGFGGDGGGVAYFLGHKISFHCDCLLTICHYLITLYTIIA